MRSSRSAAPAPAAGLPAALAAALPALADGADFRATLEELLRALDPDAADALMMLLKESRGAFAVLLPDATPGARALFLGSPFSGTPIALATLGWQVTAAARDLAGLAFLRARSRAHAAAPLDALVLGDSARLPLRDGAFDLVVQEGGLPAPATGWRHGPRELRRVSRGTVAVTADNRFGYKRSTGQRGGFVKDPRVLLREALWPSRAEHGLSGTRAAVRGDWPVADAYALYPHSREFSHVVALDAPRPALTVRRRERRNGLKVLGQRLGLFPWLTPSFAVIARRRGPARPRFIDPLLDAVARRTGEPRPELDVLVATRSNDAIVHTALPGHGEDDAAGRWTLHVPLQPAKRRMVEVHHRWLTELAGRFPTLPLPEPLFLGEGRRVAAVERRLPGITGADLTGDRAATARMFEDTATHFAGLVVEVARPLDGARFDALVGARVELALRRVPGAATRRALSALRDEARERMVGRDLPLTLYHADLRAKHVQVRPDGRVVGYLDWGASEAAFVPYLDLLHLVLHQRKQEEGDSLGRCWQLVREPQRLAPHEASALDRYCAALRLDPEARGAIELLYPALVAGMAERNWDYSRPDWVHRQFGL